MKHPRYVELIRVSTRGQADRETPADQRRALDRLRLSRPGILVERIEQQVSGAAAGEDRPDLSRLAELAALRAFDEVRVRHIDRLTRHEDPLERAAVLSMVKRAGAVIVDAGGSVLDPATMGGELTWVVSTLASAEERRKIAERTIAGKRRLAAEGRLVNSTPPWGRAFDRDTGAWSLTPAARDYRRLFDLALAGRTLWQIAADLSNEGISSPRGRPWTAGMVHNLVRNPHAAGHYTTHGHTTPIPAIVDEATQREAVERLRSHDHAGGAHARHPALLRKLLVCGACGAPCHTNRNMNGRPYYHCSARDPACYRAHPIADVDAAVKARLAAWAKRAGVAAAEGAPGAGEAARSELAASQAALRKVATEEARLADLAVQGTLPAAAVKAAAEKVAARRAAAERRIEAAKLAIESDGRRAEMAESLAARLDALRKGISRAGFAEWRELVELLFSRPYHVAIWPDGHVKLRGALPLDAKGEAALGNASRHSGKGWSVPVDLAARVRGAC